jgi:hypothetical protein
VKVVVQFFLSPNFPHSSPIDFRVLATRCAELIVPEILVLGALVFADVAIVHMDGVSVLARLFVVICVSDRSTKRVPNAPAIKVSAICFIEFNLLGQLGASEMALADCHFVIVVQGLCQR